MTAAQNKLSSTSAPDVKPPSKAQSSALASDQLALPLTDDERKASRRQLATLHRGNRMRLMLGQPLLRQDPASGASR